MPVQQISGHDQNEDVHFYYDGDRNLFNDEDECEFHYYDIKMLSLNRIAVLPGLEVIGCSPPMVELDATKPKTVHLCFPMRNMVLGCCIQICFRWLNQDEPGQYHAISQLMSFQHLSAMSAAFQKVSTYVFRRVTSCYCAEKSAVQIKGSGNSQLFRDSWF